MRDGALLLPLLRAEKTYQSWQLCAPFQAFPSRVALLVYCTSGAITVVQRVLVWLSSHLTWVGIQRVSICKS